MKNDLVMDRDGHKAYCRGKPITLRKKEYDLLEFLTRNPGRILNRLSILEYVWNYNAQIATNTLEVHIAALRRKIEGKQNGKMIKTIHGIGYIFSPRG
jgi:DNA-binding response OmpR family regulator